MNTAMYLLASAVLFALAALITADPHPFVFQPSSHRPRFTPLRPPALPLVVRSPYLSTWMSTYNQETLNGQWPIFWTGAEVGWSGLIRVDEVTYEWLGYPRSALANVISVETEAVKYTATKTKYTLSAGPVGINVTFLTPITLDDLRRQSLPASYLSLSFWSLDSKNHSVSLYTDIDGNWLSGEPNSIIQWSVGLNTRENPEDKAVISHVVRKSLQGKFSEWADKAEWGEIYWSTSMDKRVTYQIGSSDEVRTKFLARGALADTIDSDVRPINERPPVFAFSHNIGTVSTYTLSQDVLFTIGFIQDPIVQFASPTGLKEYAPLWKSYFSSALDMIYFHYQDYADSQELSSKLDAKMYDDAYRASNNENYSAIVALSARQTVGGIVFAESAPGPIFDGNGSKPLVFLKEISSDGNMNTVDVIFPASPIYLYLQPEILGLLLEPLFLHQEAGLYPNKYSMHDLGSSFPNATGHPEGNDEYMPVEECGNMIFMALAYSNFVNDINYLEKHYKILRQWTQYLVDFGLIPATQVSTDDFAGPLANQTNLALKAILGIRAMSEIATLTKNTADAEKYLSISKKYIEKWEGYAFEKHATHAKLAYQLNDSWGSLYNAYPDYLLDLQLFPERLHDIQDAWYYIKTEKYGLPLDSRHTYTKSDWEMFIAAISSSKTRNRLFDRLARWINETSTDRPFTDLYDTINTGGYPGITFINRPVVGGHFALLALDKARKLRRTQIEFSLETGQNSLQ